MMIGSTNALQPHGRKVHAPAAAPALRVLIVEDDAAVAEALADMVTDLGHRVVATERSRDAALDAAAQVEADIAILDINLGGRPAFPVADRLQARGVPVIFATGFGILELTGKYADAPLLKKPFDSAALAVMLQRFRRAA